MVSCGSTGPRFEYGCIIISSAPSDSMVAALYATYGNNTEILSKRSLRRLMILNAVIGSPPLLIIKKSISRCVVGILCICFII